MAIIKEVRCVGIQRSFVAPLQSGTTTAKDSDQIEKDVNRTNRAKISSNLQKTLETRKKIYEHPTFWLKI